MKHLKQHTVSLAILVLIRTIYYYAKRHTGGLVNETDTFVCGTVGLICVIIIISYLVQLIKKYQEHE